MNIATIGPVQAAERMHVLDIIRGFALFGILMMNIEFFQRPLQGIMVGFNTDQTGLDFAVAWFSLAFVQGKFYTMFSFLFGLGFVIFLDRAMQRGASAKWLFSRRLAVLLVFGLIHCFLIWGGDILHTYAVVGFLLLFFVKTPAQRLWKWGIAFWALPILFMWLGALGIQAAQNAPDGGAEMLAGFAEGRTALLADVARGEIIYATGTYLEVVQWRIHEWRSLYMGGGVFFFVPMILGLFLIGASFGRAGVFADLAAHAGLFRRMMLFGFGIGIPLTLFWGINGMEVDMTFPTPTNAMLMTANNIASLALCLAYMGTLATLVRLGKVWTVKLAPVGRMALTNYLTHSVVFTLLFYGYGLGVWGEVGRAGATLMAIALYGFQIWFSGWWLQRYRMGPVEWVWRSLTYGFASPFRIR